MTNMGKPMFSKRHYEAMASMLKRNYPGTIYDPKDKAWEQWIRIRNDTMKMFAEDNPSFNQDKFVRVCVPDNN